MTKLVTAAVVLVLAVLGPGCGRSSERAANPIPDDPAELARLLQGTIQYDYEPFTSPAAMRVGSEIAIVGHVVGVTPGKIYYPEENTGVTIVALKVEENWRPDGTSPGNTVYYLTHRPKEWDIEIYRHALPQGTRVVFFGSPTTYKLVEGAPRATVYEPLPQGLMFEMGDSSLLNVFAQESDRYPDWKGIRTLDDLRGRLALEPPEPVGGSGATGVLPRETTTWTGS